MSSASQSELQKLIRELEETGERLEALINLSNKIKDEETRITLSYNEFLNYSARRPEHIFRDIFQIFHDMVNHYVPEGIDEYPKSEDTIGFKHFDTSDLFEKDCDNPFYADRLLVNRFIKLVNSFTTGTLRNRIILFEGPPGSGKSTFLNNLLNKFEQYTNTSEGAVYQTFWCLDLDKLGSFEEVHFRLGQQLSMAKDLFADKDFRDKKKFLSFPCPNHDHPILQIPKVYRKRFLDELIIDSKFKAQLFRDSEYEWVFKDTPCSICSSFHSALLDMLGDPLEVYKMIKIRRMAFNRQTGLGISVFNPSDPISKKPIETPRLQESLDQVFKHEPIRYLYSFLAKTNNGILSLMDIKENNAERLTSMHSIISDGFHKVEYIEERIKTLFLGIINPDDRKHYEAIPSFKDRVVTVNIPYILDYNTEVAIYEGKFGKCSTARFMPGVLENFAKIIISSRMKTKSSSIEAWLKHPDKYDKYVDKYFLLLKMDLYTGKIPSWLSEEDVRALDYKTRKSILKASIEEGGKGFSGRQSIFLFNALVGRYLAAGDAMISMEMVERFFTEDKELLAQIPVGFIKSVKDMYNYTVLQQVKEASYSYNNEQITREILNYLFAINYEPEVTKKSTYTGDQIQITEDYFKLFELTVLGSGVTDDQRSAFRKDMQSIYISRTLSQEIRVEGKQLNQTDQFADLFKKYTKMLKQNALSPYLENENFRRAIVAHGTENYKTFDKRLQREVDMLLANLKGKFKYNKRNAKQVSLYVLDNKLSEKYG